MYLSKSDELMERPIRRRLAERVLQLFGSSEDERREYTFNHIAELVDPPSLAVLALVLAELNQRRLLDKVVRVESPETHGGIQDFRSSLDVPEEIHDIYSDRWINVTPENIRIVFRTPLEAVPHA